MKALLLVGGFATRLRPLSLNRPKCLFPIKNKPIIGYLLENLAEAGCKEAILAVNNLADKIKASLGDEKYGIRIHYSLEETPLGTGGPIKLAEKQLMDDDFLVLNGDILSFIDYRELMYLHRKGKAIATLTLKQVNDPTRYGVVEFGDNDSILEFVEKPEKEYASSNWINAGCYALSPEILRCIPEGKSSIERDVFPRLASKNRLKGYRYYGEWVDIGVPEDYLVANKMLQTIKRERASSISPDSRVGEGSKVLDSIIWENSYIGRNAVIMNSIIGADCSIGDHVKIDEAVIADGVKIEDSLTIATGTRIWPKKAIEASITQPNTVIR